MQTKPGVIRRWRVSKGSASQTKSVAFKSAKKICCDVTGSVTLSDRDRGVTVPNRRGLFQEINPVLLSFHVVDACLTLRHTVRRDGLGSVSSYLQGRGPHPGWLETHALPQKGHPSSVIRKSNISQVGLERECVIYWYSI